MNKGRLLKTNVLLVCHSVHLSQVLPQFHRQWSLITPVRPFVFLNASHQLLYTFSQNVGTYHTDRDCPVNVRLQNVLHLSRLCLWLGPQALETWDWSLERLQETWGWAQDWRLESCRYLGNCCLRSPDFLLGASSPRCLGQQANELPKSGSSRSESD